MANVKKARLCPMTGRILNGEEKADVPTLLPLKSYAKRSNVAHVAPLPLVDNGSESSDVEVEFIEMCKSDSLQKDTLRDKLSAFGRGSRFRARSAQHLMGREPQVIVRTFDFPKLSPLNPNNLTKLSDFPKPKERWKYQHDIVSPKSDNTKEGITGMPVLLSVSKSNGINSYNNMILPRNHSAVASRLPTSSASSLPTFTTVPQSSVASIALQSMAMASKEVKLAKVPPEMLATAKSSISVVGGKYVVLKPTSPSSSSQNVQMVTDEDSTTSQKVPKPAKVYISQTQSLNKISRPSTIIVQNNQTVCKSEAEYQNGQRIINPFDSTVNDIKPGKLLSAYDGVSGLDLIDNVSESHHSIRVRQDALQAVLRNNLLGAPLIKAPSSSPDDANTIHLEILAKDSSNFIHSTLETSAKVTSNSQDSPNSKPDVILTQTQAEQHCRVARERVRTIALHSGDNRNYRVVSVPHTKGNESGEVGDMTIERPTSRGDSTVARVLKADPILLKPAVGDTVRFSPALGKPVMVRHEMGNTVILRSANVKPIASREVDTSGLIMQDEKGNPIVVTSVNGKPVQAKREVDEARVRPEEMGMKNGQSPVDAQVADTSTRQTSETGSTSSSYASQLSAALLLTEKAQASARAAGDSQKLKKLQDEMTMLQVRHAIALQYQRDVEKESSECPVMRVVNLPARQVVLVDSSSQTTLFSLLEPGRMVEMTITKTSGKYPEVKPKTNSATAAEEATSVTTPSKNSSINTNTKGGLRPKHVVSVNSSGQIMTVTTTPSEQPVAKRAKLEDNTSRDSSPVQSDTCRTSASKNLNLQTVVPISQASEPPKNINMVIMVKDKTNASNNVNKYYIASAKQSEVGREHALHGDVKSDHKELLENSNGVLDSASPATVLSSVDNHHMPTLDLVEQHKYENTERCRNSNATVKPLSPARMSPLDNRPLPKPDVLKKLAYLDWLKCKVADASGNIPLHLAVMDEDINQVKRQCFVLAARRESIDIPNKDHETPLHLAILNASEDIVNLLLDFGAKAGVTDGKGNTSLHLAVGHSNSFSCLEILLSKDSEINKLLDTFNDEGFSPLHLCALNNKTDELAALIFKGADINIRDGKSGRTALFHATECNHAEVSRILLLNHASTTIPNFAGHTPILVANELSKTAGEFLFANKSQQTFNDLEENEDFEMEES